MAIKQFNLVAFLGTFPSATVRGRAQTFQTIIFYNNNNISRGIISTSGKFSFKKNKKNSKDNINIITAIGIGVNPGEFGVATLIFWGWESWGLHKILFYPVTQWCTTS